MVKEVDILKRSFRNSCKSFFFSCRWVGEMSKLTILMDGIDIHTYMMTRIM